MSAWLLFYLAQENQKVLQGLISKDVLVVYI